VGSQRRNIKLGAQALVPYNFHNLLVGSQGHLCCLLPHAPQETNKTNAFVHTRELPDHMRMDPKTGRTLNEC